MTNVTPLVTNDMTELLRQFEKAVKSGSVTHITIIAQTEDEDCVDWQMGEAGEINPNPEHIATFIGYTEILKLYAMEAYAEAIDE